MRFKQLKNADGGVYLVPVESTEPHYLQFEKVVRDCPYNTELLEAGSTRGLLTDYEVIYKGEHVATLIQWERNSRKYALGDIDRRFIRSNGDGTGYISYMAYDRSDWLPVCTRAIDEGKLPTREELDARHEAKLAKKRAEAAETGKRGTLDELYAFAKAVAEGDNRIPHKVYARMVLDIVEERTAAAWQLNIAPEEDPEGWREK